MSETWRLRGEFVELGSHSVPGLKGRRRVRAWAPEVPPPYSVLYFWDGQNLFDDEGSHAGGWHLHQLLSWRVAAGKPTPLLVAIDHGGKDRIGDYAPWPRREYGEGRAEATIELLLDRVMPAVERRFETAGRQGTIVGGSSMGGLLSLYAWLRFPGVFGQALAMSPSLGCGWRGLCDLIARSTPHGDARLYLDLGSSEGGAHGSRMLREVAEALVRRGLDHQRVLLRLDPLGEHREADWSSRLPLALDFLLQG